MLGVALRLWEGMHEVRTSTSRAGAYATRLSIHCSPPRHARASMYSMCRGHGFPAGRTLRCALGWPEIRRWPGGWVGWGGGRAFSAAARGYGALRMEAKHYSTCSISIGPRERQWGIYACANEAMHSQGSRPASLLCHNNSRPLKWIGCMQMGLIGTPFTLPASVLDGASCPGDMTPQG